MADRRGGVKPRAPRRQSGGEPCARATRGLDPLPRRALGLAKGRAERFPRPAESRGDDRDAPRDGNQRHHDLQLRALSSGSPCRTRCRAKHRATPNGTAGGTVPGQQRDSGGTKQKTLNPSNDDVACASAPPVSAQAVALAEDIATIAGLAARRDWPPGWRGAALRAQAFLDHGWRPDVMLASARATMARKRDGPPTDPLFRAAVCEAHAAQAAPLPEIHAPRFTQVPHAAARSPHGRHRAAYRVPSRTRSRGWRRSCSAAFAPARPMTRRCSRAA